MDHYACSCLLSVMPLCTSVCLYLVLTYWERAGLLVLVCGVSLQVCHFPIGILCQVWYLIVFIPDLCTLTYFFSCELRHEISKTVVCVTSKASNQPVYMRSLIRAFASR